MHMAQRSKENSAIEASERAPRSSKLDPYKNRIGELFTKYPDITARRVYEVLTEEGFEGGYVTVRTYVRKTRPRKVEPSLETPVWDPGEMGECDWSPYTIDFTRTGRATVQAFSYVLAHSTRKYFGFYERSDLHALMDGHVQSFERFQGCAKGCKYDSQKAVVLRWEGQQPIYNPRFLAFATYYEFRPHALLGNPNGKPRVERSFWELTRSFFNGRTFSDMADLEAQLGHWLASVCDQRKRRGVTVLERFEKEKGYLLPLPTHPYDTARVAYRLCSIDGYIDWEANRYAVPYEYVTDILAVRATQRELFIYGPSLQCIARHELCERGQGLKIDPLGLHAGRKAAGFDLELVKQAFQDMGEGARDFLRVLCTHPPRFWGYQARRILLLRSRYNTSDIVSALEHALRFGAFEACCIERILAARCPVRTLDEYVNEQTQERLKHVLGQDKTEPRDLREYDGLQNQGTQAIKETQPCQNQGHKHQVDQSPQRMACLSDSEAISSSSD
jgi:transposase